MHAIPRQAGFTLAELVISIAILAILTSFAAQSWSSFADRSRQRAILEHFHTLFAYARWSAASERSLVTVCPLSAQNRCEDKWHHAISVFRDADNDKRPDNDEILRRFDADLGLFSLRSRTAGRGYFQFDEEGMSHGAMGSLVLCPPPSGSGTMTYMPMNIAGRFRVEYDNDDDRMMQLPWGTKISC